MNLTKLIAALLLISLSFLSCSKDDPGEARPKTGTTKKITADIEYVNGQIDGSESWATWPVAKIAQDGYAVKYSVKVLQTDKIYSWEKGQKVDAAYAVFADRNGLKDGNIYVGLGRTWCAGCSNFNAEWEQTYRTNVFDRSNKVEITIYY